MSNILYELKEKAFHCWQVGERFEDIKDIIDKAYSQGYISGQRGNKCALR